MDGNELKLVILMTGTIKPNSFLTLALTDSEERKLQYIEAIKFYLNHTSLRIVFAENSGNCLSTYFEEYNKRIEFITFISQAKNVDKGKGSKEMEILDYAMKHSKFIAEAKTIIKITGRLKVLNIKLLCFQHMRYLKRHKNLVVCNAISIKSRKMDSRCFIYTLGFWKYLKKNGLKINENKKKYYSFERALWDSVLDFKLKKGGFKQFATILKISGISGGFKTRYDDTSIRAFAKQIRHFCTIPYVYYKFRSLF